MVKYFKTLMLVMILLIAYIPEGSARETENYMHVSFDDVYESLSDITANADTYTSVFDNGFFTDLKSLHDTYGAVFTLNCFVEADDYSISDLTDKFKTELSDNSDWLKFAFHAQNSGTKYNTDKVNTIKASYDTFTNAIVNAAGESSIDRVVRLGFYTGTLNNINAIKAGDYGILGILTRDDSQTYNYYLSSEQKSYINENNKLYDSDNDVFMIKTQTRLENITSEAECEEELAKFESFEGNGINILEIFTHESPYLTSSDDDAAGAKSNLEAYLKWAKERDYTFTFAQDIMDDLKAEGNLLPEKETPELPDGDADYVWDFSEYTETINGTGIKQELEYNGLQIGIKDTRDEISTQGLYWKGQSDRYVSYTPEYDGILYVRGKDSAASGSMKLKSDTEDELASIDSNGEIIYECAAGITYYIVPTADYQRVYEMRYYKTFDEKYDPAPDIGDKVYYIVQNADGESTVVDTSKLYTDERVLKFRITTADADGNKILQYTADISDSVTVETADAAKVEIAPVYGYTDLSSLGTETVLDGYFENGTYDISVLKGRTDRRADIYINGGMIANNLYSIGYDTDEAQAANIVNVMSDEEKSTPYTAHDVVVSGNKISVQLKDCSVYTISSMEVVKSPSITNRKPKVWVIGDSLVQKYYGSAENEQKGQRGWGQFLKNFLTDEVEVVNLANAGHYAKGLMETALSGVTANGMAGDYFIIEGGYNDYKHYSADKFYEYTVSMVNTAKQMGITPILVSPNASIFSDADTEDKSGWYDVNSYDDFQPDVRYAATVKKAAEDTGAYYIDLSALSYEFYSETYGTDDDAKKAINDTYLLGTNIDSGLHHNHLGAIKWAEIVVQSLYDQKILSCVDKNYSYIYTDSLGTEFTLKITDDEPAKTECVKIEAEYNTDGSLADIAISKEYVENLTGTEQDSDTPLKKTYYWESMENMKPIKLD